MAANEVGLPPGFQLDAAPAGAPAAVPGLPAGFTLDQPTVAGEVMKAAQRGPIEGADVLRAVGQGPIGMFEKGAYQPIAAAANYLKPSLNLPSHFLPNVSDALNKLAPGYEQSIAPDPNATAGPRYAGAVTEAVTNPATWVGPGGPLLKAGSAIASGIGGQLGADTGIPGGRFVGSLAGGAVGGVGAQKAGNIIENARLARTMPPPGQPGNFAQVGDVNVPLTPGQVSGDVTSQRFVESARMGTLGERAKSSVLDFDARQQAAVDRARENIQSDLGGGSALATDPYQAAEVVQQGVQGQAQALKAQSQRLYDQFGQMEGSVGSEAFKDIGAGIKADLAGARNPYIVSDKTTPAASQMLDHLDRNLSELKIQNKATGPGAAMPAGEPAQISAVSLKGLDQSRRELLSIARGAERGSEDARASQAIIRAFDNRLQNAVNSHLYTGDPAAFETLQGARKLWATYAQTFKSQGPGDMAGKVVEKMIGRHDQPASLNDISNWLYGANGMGGSSTAVSVYKKLGNIFGQSSQEMQALRQGLFSRLTETAADKIGMGPQKTSQRIFEFLNGQGRQLAETAFSPQERALIDQYGQLQKRLTPVRGAVNYSNSGHQIASMMKWTVNALATVGGLHVGGIPGAAAGYVANKAGNTLIERAHAREISRHLYQPAQQFTAGSAGGPNYRRAAALGLLTSAKTLPLPNRTQ